MIRVACTACLLLFPVASVAQTLAVKDSVGATVGFYVGPGSTTQQNAIFLGSVRVVSASGYASTFNARRGRPDAFGGAGTTPDGGVMSAEVYFQSSDCTGQGFASTGIAGSNLLDLGWIPMPGSVFPLGTSNTSYAPWYVPKTSAAVLVSALPALLSRLVNPGICQAGSGLNPETVLYPAAPNDPGVTGFPNVPFVPPLTIEPVPVSAVFSIFRDSFESPQASIAHEGLIDAALAESSRYS